MSKRSCIRDGIAAALVIGALGASCAPAFAMNMGGRSGNSPGGPSSGGGPSSTGGSPGGSGNHGGDNVEAMVIVKCPPSAAGGRCGERRTPVVTVRNTTLPHCDVQHWRHIITEEDGAIIEEYIVPTRKTCDVVRDEN